MITACDEVTYVIELEGDRFYVGKTHKLKDRLSRHFRGSGAKCCKPYKVLRVVEVLQGDVEADTYYRYFNNGHDVRGHAFTLSF